MMRRGPEAGTAPLFEKEMVRAVTETAFFSVQVLEEWNKGELDSYLIEISRDIFKFKDTDGQSLVDKIRDTAGQVRGYRDS